MTKIIDSIAEQYPQISGLTAFSGANTTTPYLADKELKYQLEY